MKVLASRLPVTDEERRSKTLTKEGRARRQGLKKMNKKIKEGKDIKDREGEDEIETTGGQRKEKKYNRKE